MSGRSQAVGTTPPASPVRRSAPVNTATTPGCSAAAEVSIEVTLACA